MEKTFVVVNENNKIIRTSDKEDVIDEQVRQLTEAGQVVKKRENITS